MAKEIKEAKEATEGGVQMAEQNMVWRSPTEEASKSPETNTTVILSYKYLCACLEISTR